MMNELVADKAKAGEYQAMAPAQTVPLALVQSMAQLRAAIREKLLGCGKGNFVVP